MKVLVCFVYGVSLVWSSAPSSLSRILPRQFGSDAVQVSSYIGPSNYPGYYIYNYLQIDQGREIPIGIFANGRPDISNVQPTYTYFGTPDYDYRYHFNQIFPGFPGFQPPLSVPNGQPSFVPAQRPPSFQPATQRPFVEDDTIEKLDEKLDPSLQDNSDDSAHREDDNDDTVTIEAAANP